MGELLIKIYLLTALILHSVKNSCTKVAKASLSKDTEKRRIDEMAMV